jgi:hemerythrin-like domain-containing protein
VTSSVSKFYAEDHSRLDGLFEQFLNLKEKNPEQAKQILEQFKSGLEQHMAWEEAILFSEFDAKSAFGDEESPTVDLRFEHEELRGYLEALQKKLRENNFDTGHDEARLAELLAGHNFVEESGIYLKLDELLSDKERADIFQQMKDAALP